VIDKLLDLIPSWLWAGVVLALTVACAGLYIDLAASDLALANSRAANAKLNTAIADSKAEAAERSAEMQRVVTRATNEAKKREDVLRASAATARAESVGLRSDAAGLRDQLANASRDAAIDRAAAIAGVLGQCGARYQVLAERCDRHVSDLRTLTDAWPK
jgi:hypothetical protein